MSAWPTVKHFASWLRLTPRNDISGGQVFRSRTGKTGNRAAQAFRIAAQAMQRTDSASYYEELHRQRPLKNLERKAARLDMRVVPTAT